MFNKINWDPKSANVSKTIHQMNINPNTIVFVDDNPFERNEVLLAQPNITCVNPSEMIACSKCKRFDVVVTEDSKMRRQTYKMIESMKEKAESLGANAIIGLKISYDNLGGTMGNTILVTAYGTAIKYE